MKNYALNLELVLNLLVQEVVLFGISIFNNILRQIFYSF